MFFLLFSVPQGLEQSPGRGQKRPKQRKPVHDFFCCCFHRTLICLATTLRRRNLVIISRYTAFVIYTFFLAFFIIIIIIFFFIHLDFLTPRTTIVAGTTWVASTTTRVQSCLSSGPISTRVVTRTTTANKFCSTCVGTKSVMEPPPGE